MFPVLDLGTVLKVVTIPRESWHDLEEVVLEEMTVFRVRSHTGKLVMVIIDCIYMENIQ